MDGITILSTTEELAFLPGLALFMGIVIGTGTLIVGIGFIFDGWPCVALTILICIMCLSFAIWGYRQPRDTVYKVTVDDSVSFNAFNNKYQILSQEGAIIKVMEREAENER